MKKNDTVLGKRLRSLIRYRGISQKDLAASLSIAVSTLNGYIMGYRSPDYFTLANIANILFCSFDYLLNETPIKLNVENGRSYLIELADEKGCDLPSVAIALKIDFDILLGFYDYQFNLNEPDIIKIADFFNTTTEYILNGYEASNMIFTPKNNFLKKKFPDINIDSNNNKDDEILMLAKDMSELPVDDFELLKNLVLSMKKNK